MKRKQQTLKDVGAAGEDEALRFLADKGLQILDKNWRIKDGEIDLICEESNTIVFVEVKTRRSSTFGTPFDAITPEKAFRLQRLALAWMATSHRWGQDYRIDAIGVVIDSAGFCSIEHRVGVL